MINYTESQKPKEEVEAKALRVLGEEGEAALGGPPNPKFEGYYDISQKARIENPFPITHQDQPKGDISIRNLYIMVQQGFKKPEVIFKSTLNKLEIRMLKEILALQKENTEHKALTKDLYQEMEKNKRIGQTLTPPKLIPLPAHPR
jgi:hypothetical protein